MADAQESLKKLSQYAGMRFDWVQAGGGNASVKVPGQGMLIKASGISLSEVNAEQGYVVVNDEAIRHFINNATFDEWDKREREQKANDCVMKSRIDSVGKPSIETLLHAVMHTYTLHTHPIAVNALVAQKNWQTLCQSVSEKSLCIEYATPGIELALLMQSALRNYPQENSQSEKIIFLQNHGLIVSSESMERVIQITEDVVNLANQHAKMELSAYAITTKISQALANAGFTDRKVIYSLDSVIQRFMNDALNDEQSVEIWPFCPDTLVYCGVKPLILNASFKQVSIESLTRSIQIYQQTYQQEPKVFCYEDATYTTGLSLKKAQDTEALFRFHCHVLLQNGQSVQRLTADEVSYLLNWDAEKYRQGV